MTTKPEVHNVSLCHQDRTEQRPQHSQKLVEFRHVVTKICVQTVGKQIDRQTDRQTDTDTLITIFRSQWQRLVGLYGFSSQTYIKYSLDFLRIIAEAFEAVDWLADLPQRTWPQASSPVE